MVPERTYTGQNRQEGHRSCLDSGSSATTLEGYVQLPLIISYVGWNAVSIILFFFRKFILVWKRLPTSGKQSFHTEQTEYFSDISARRLVRQWIRLGMSRRSFSEVSLLFRIGIASLGGNFRVRSIIMTLTCALKRRQGPPCRLSGLR